MQQTSRATIKHDGNTLRTKPGASAQAGGPQRKGEMTDQGVFMYKETLVPGMIKGTVMHASDSEYLALRDAKDITVTYSTDSGVVLTMSNAVVAELGDLSGGEFDVTFVGDPLK